MVPHGTQKSGQSADNDRGMNGYETMLKIWVSMAFPDVVNPLWGTLEGRTHLQISQHMFGLQIGCEYRMMILQ